MEQPQKKSMHLVEGPYIGIYASGHNGAVRLEITENNQVKFHEAEAHGSGSIWESANGKKFISLVFHHSAKETIQQLSDHLLTERFPGLFMDKWNDVFYVCPQFFAQARKDTDTELENRGKLWQIVCLVREIASDCHSSFQNWKQNKKSTLLGFCYSNIRNLS